MKTITRKLEFDSGHRVLGHEGRCQYIHGHRYVAEITVSAEQLNNLGMVIDFSKIKEAVGTWIDNCWDHNFLIHPDDEDLYEYFSKFENKNPHVMKYGNPTAENIARELFEKSVELLGAYNISVINIRIFETPNCFADYSSDSVIRDE